nr:uncharacterized protein LOC118682230 [Bactrocera oleae]
MYLITMDQTTFDNELREAFEKVRMLKEAKNREEFCKVVDAIYCKRHEAFLLTECSSEGILDALISTVIEKKLTLLKNMGMLTSEELKQIETDVAETKKRKAAPHDYSSFDGYCDLVLAALSDKSPIIYVETDLSRRCDDTHAEDQLDDDENDMLIIDEYILEEPHGDDDDVNSSAGSDQLVPTEFSESESVNTDTIETVRTFGSPESVAELQELDESFEFIVIGPNGTQVLKSEFDKIPWASVSISTRSLLSILFSEDILATHTLSGKPSPAFLDRQRPLKGQLDSNKVNDLIHCVMQKMGCMERDIRTVITTKCADISKKYRKRSIKISYIDLTTDKFI